MEASDHWSLGTSWRKKVSEVNSWKETLKIGVQKEKKTNEFTRVIKPVFGQYVTRDSDFKEELEDLLRRIRSYAQRETAKRPFNILLASEPGSGKSFLLKQIADNVKSGITAQFDEYHVGAFRGMEDLYGAFQRVQSANLRGELPFVFFDEVDAKVHDRYIIPNFLAPMWDGVFHIGKESFSLGRAIFAFGASSMLKPPDLEAYMKNPQWKIDQGSSHDKFIKAWTIDVESQLFPEPKERNKDSENGNNEGPRFEKLRDFVDRIDKMICIPPLRKELLGEQYQQELMDIVCIMVKKHFKKVKLIELSALFVLAEILSTSKFRRSSERTIFASNSTTTKFAFTNLPGSTQREFQEMFGDSMHKWVHIEVK